MSEIALWRAVIKQAVDDSRIIPGPLPELPPKLSREERMALPVEERRALTLARRKIGYERNRIVDDQLAKQEAVAWLRGTSKDFNAVIELTSGVEAETATSWKCGRRNQCSNGQS